MPAPHFIDGLYRDSIKGGIGYFFPSVSFQSLDRESGPARDFAQQTGGRSVVVGWLGSRYSLTREEPFTESELKLLRSIGTVSDSRYRMVVEATHVEQRVELFRGLPEDRYVSAYIDRAPYDEPVWKGPDAVACMRVAARWVAMSAMRIKHESGRPPPSIQEPARR